MYGADILDINDMNFDTTSLIRLNVNDFENFKTACKKNNVTVAHALRDLLSKYVDETRTKNGTLHIDKKERKSSFTLRLPSSFKEDFNNACEINCHSQILIITKLVEKYIKENTKE